VMTHSSTASSAVSSPESRYKLAVIIPMFNEELGAKRCVEAVCQVLSDRVPGVHLFAVNDGSRDRTESVLRSLEAPTLPFTVVSYSQNRGYGAALLEGARVALSAGYDFGLFMDSDLTNDPALIPLFEDAIQGGRVDVIKASRYISGGGMSQVPWYRQVISKVGNFIASRLCNIGIRDCTNGFRAVRLSLLSQISFQERGFPSIVEELYLLKKLGARFREVPYVLTARTGDQAASSFQYTFKMFATYLKYCVKAALVPRASTVDNSGR
jgi:dolichol-phosphate mannosyltransferase